MISIKGNMSVPIIASRNVGTYIWWRCQTGKNKTPVEWRICLVVFPSVSNHFEIVPCNADVLVFDACSLGGVIGGGKVFAKVETLFSLDIDIGVFLDVLGKALRLEGG